MKEQIKAGQIVAVEMKYYDSKGNHIETKTIPGRVQKCCVHGVFIENQIIGYDQISPATDIHVQAVINEEDRVSAMLRRGNELMEKLIEPEFI